MGFKLNWDSTQRFPFHGEEMPTNEDGFGIIENDIVENTASKQI